LSQFSDMHADTFRHFLGGWIAHAPSSWSSTPPPRQLLQTLRRPLLGTHAPRLEQRQPATAGCPRRRRRQKPPHRKPHPRRRCQPLPRLRRLPRLRHRRHRQQNRTAPRLPRRRLRRPFPAPRPLHPR
jgi:hypothetical protein